MGKMMESLAGHIHSAEDSSIDDIKRAIIPGCGCPEETLLNIGGIRIFIVGNFGTAKTKLLKLATKTHPGSRFTTAEAVPSGYDGWLPTGRGPLYRSQEMGSGSRCIPLTHPDGVCAIDSSICTRASSVTSTPPWRMAKS